MAHASLLPHVESEVAVHVPRTHGDGHRHPVRDARFEWRDDPARFDAHTLLFSSLAIILGFQAITFGVFARKYGIDEGLLFASPGPGRWLRWLTLERGLLLGGVVFVAGAAILAMAVVSWLQVDFGDLDYSTTMRLVIPGFTLAALGFQVILSSFLVTVLGIDVHPHEHG